jgi:O-antigen ligase
MMSLNNISKGRNNQKIFLVLLQIGIITSAISVSISQLFLGLAFLLFLFDPKRRSRIQPSPIVITTLLLFSAYFVSIIWNYWGMALDTNTLQVIKQSEFKDLLLFLSFFLTATLSREEIGKVKTAFIVLIIILGITGFFSIFSIYRFTYLFNSLFRTVTSWQFQHHYGEIGGVNIYLPIGLMNTHLTFGGLLMFFTPFLLFKFWESIFEKKSILLKILEFFLLSCFFMVVLLNNARSSIFGSGVGILFGIMVVIFIKKGITFKKILKFFVVPTIILSVIVMSLSFSTALRKTILPLLGSEKHTDSGRTFIWDSTFYLIEKSPLLGVGPGRYSSQINTSRKERSEKNQKLLYFYEVTQRGHSHNDYFHIAAISGIGSVFFYLGILYFIIAKILEKSENLEDTALYYGLVGFFFAGLFQCYFQDDEVVLVFWYLAGFLFNPLEEEKKV